jgi:hypothetical protein
MDAGEGRNGSFTNGAMTSTANYAMQNPGAGYHPTSALDSLPSGNGLSAPDRSRMLLGGSMMPSPNGVASDTYAARSWITTPTRTVQ